MANNAETIAYCWQNGKVEFGTYVPDGALGIAKGRERLLIETVTILATLGYEKGVLLVPGLPTADNNDERPQAVNDFRDMINERLETYALPEGIEWDEAEEDFLARCPDCGHRETSDRYTKCPVCGQNMPTLADTDWPHCSFCDAPETPDGNCWAGCEDIREE